MDELLITMTYDELDTVRVYLAQKKADLQAQYDFDPSAALNSGVHDELLTAGEWLREVDEAIARTRD